MSAHVFTRYFLHRKKKKLEVSLFNFEQVSKVSYTFVTMSELKFSCSVTARKCTRNGNFVADGASNIVSVLATVTLRILLNLTCALIFINIGIRMLYSWTPICDSIVEAKGTRSLAYGFPHLSSFDAAFLLHFFSTSQLVLPVGA